MSPEQHHHARHSDAHDIGAKPHSQHGDIRITGLMQAYLDAVYRWEHGGHWFSLRIGEPAIDLQTAFPDAGEFGLLSAWNPYSVEQPEITNRAADSALHAALSDSGAVIRPGFSSARNRSWREPSWVTINLPMAWLDALAGRFGQLGTLHGQRDEPVRLRMYHARPAALPPTKWVDWLPVTGR